MTVSQKKNNVNALNQDILMLIILPKSATHISYYINSNPEKRVKKINKMYEFITTFFTNPSKLYKIKNLLWEFQAFILDIENQSILILTNDKIKEQKEKEKILNERAKKIDIKSLVKPNTLEHWRNTKLKDKFWRLTQY